MGNLDSATSIGILEWSFDLVLLIHNNSQQISIIFEIFTKIPPNLERIATWFQQQLMWCFFDKSPGHKTCHLLYEQDEITHYREVGIWTFSLSRIIFRWWLLRPSLLVSFTSMATSHSQRYLGPGLAEFLPQLFSGVFAGYQ